jgi:MoxR-like ATPase
MVDFARFEGTERYIADPALQSAVNASLTLERPLLVKGEPGTGKTLLAEAVAESLDMELYRWHIKSTTKAIEGLYTYDVVRRLNDARFGDGDVRDVGAYITHGVLGRAFGAAERKVVLIDEVDKADLEFPNDLLNELDAMRFFVHETEQEVVAEHRPVVIITSNAEKELPDAFLRRCVFHFIEFPDKILMERIVRVHHPDLPSDMLESAIVAFYGLREVNGLRKPPSTSELIDWLFVLVRAGVPASELARNLPFLGVLLKQEQDLERVQGRV